MARKRKPDAYPLTADLFAQRCDQCQRQLLPTESGYLACPVGHGRLIRDEATVPHFEPSGLWNDFDLTAAGM